MISTGSSWGDLREEFVGLQLGFQLRDGPDDSFQFLSSGLHKGTELWGQFFLRPIDFIVGMYKTWDLIQKSFIIKML